MFDLTTLSESIPISGSFSLRYPFDYSSFFSFSTYLITIDLLSVLHEKTKITEECFWVYGVGGPGEGSNRMKKIIAIYSQESSMFRTWAEEEKIVKPRINYHRNYRTINMECFKKESKENCHLLQRIQTMQKKGKKRPWNIREFLCNQYVKSMCLFMCPVLWESSLIHLSIGVTTFSHFCTFALLA